MHCAGWLACSNKTSSKVIKPQSSLSPIKPQSTSRINTMSNMTSHQGSTFREYLPDLSVARFITMQKQNAHEYAQAFKSGGQPPWLHGLYQHWRRLFEEPYKGITNDGNCQNPCWQQRGKLTQHRQGPPWPLPAPRRRGSDRSHHLSGKFRARKVIWEPEEGNLLSHRLPRMAILVKSRVSSQR